MGQEWLRRGVRSHHFRLVAKDSAAEPLRWAEATWWLTRRRAPTVLRHNIELVAREYDVNLIHPLLDERFLAAIACAGGRWGFESRTAMMRWLFSDLLPDAVLSRSTKASFNHAHFGPAAREFARTWDGSGVDDSLVDPKALREHWLSEKPFGITGLLLQQAWLSQHHGDPVRTVRRSEAADEPLV
jgi:asparagine synthase (glutamine-hydrolysing)